VKPSSLACSGAAALAAVALLPTPAHAAPTRDHTTVLCEGTTVPCSVQVPTAWADGRANSVAVTGNPDVTVRVQAQRMVGTGSGATYEKLGEPVTIRTDDHGFGEADLDLPRLDDEEPGGPLLLTMADADLDDLGAVVGAWSTLAARSPRLHGDGFDRRKPVDTDLVMVVSGALGGSRYDVEIDQGGTWTSVGTSASTSCAAAEPCAVGYRLPRGLQARPYTVRLVDMGSGAPAGSWTAVPDDAGTPTPRVTDELPVVGSDVDGAVSQGGDVISAVPRPRSGNLELPEGITLPGQAAALAGQHPDHLVRGAAATLTLAALVCALGLLRRRRV